MRGDEAEKRVYRVVRDAAKQRRRATISEVVAATGMARSSVHRVAQRLGYDSWLDFTTGLVRYYAGERKGDPVSTSVEAVVEALLRSWHQPVLIDAVGDAEICSSYLLYRLGERGFFPMPFTEEIARACDSQGRTGIVFVVNESGMSLLPTCIAAVENGFGVISITSSHDTPVSKVSTINVVIKNNKSSIDSYEPNYFAAGTLAFLERVLNRVGKERPFV